ncbi:MAG: hypothetical protein ACHREM_32910, partial [Polyangiales bacterium]
MTRTSLALLLCLTTSCGRFSSAPSKTRSLVIRGLPTCPKDGRFERPIVARIDDEPGLFGDRFSTQRAMDASPHALADADGGKLELTLPRRRMKATLRIG